MTKNPTTEPVQPCPNPEPCSDHPRATHETPLLLLIDTLRAENAELRKRVEAAEGLLRMIVDTHDLTLPASVWKVVDAHLSTATSGGE